MNPSASLNGLVSLMNVQRNSMNPFVSWSGGAVLSPKNRLYPWSVSPPCGWTRAIPPPA
jgi:hypothetical protein